ncbi:MAG: tetratricopeptide repeat protein [Candidatus Cloacimonadota bacterium]|nr:tetratricopeptide repeat protein [Candidatus Cloacimonadota bacterium]
MKYKALIFFLFILVSSVLFAEYDISIPNKAYQDQNYTKAKEGYEEVVKQGVENFILFYNLGNTYFKLGEKGLARLYYEKAKRFQPQNKELSQNIDLLKSTLKDKEETQETFLEQVAQNIFYFFSINLLTIFGIASFMILMLITAFMVISRSDVSKKIIRAFMLLFSILFVFFLIFTVTRLMQFHSKNSAVILGETVLAYSGPTQEFEQVFTIHEGLKVKIEKFDGDWVLIKLPTGNGGWILKENIGEI